MNDTLTKHKIIKILTFGYVIQDEYGRKYWTSDFKSKTLIN